MIFYDDQEKWISEKVLLIEDLTQREEFRRLMTQIMFPLSREIAVAKENMEKNIQMEDDRNRQIEIVMGLMNHEELFLHEESFGAVLERDTEQILVDPSELMASLKKGEGYPLYSVYLNCDYETLLRIENSAVFFPVELVTEYGSYIGQAELVRDQAYDEPLEDLYEIFFRNGFQFFSLNTKYIRHMYRIVIRELESPILETEIKRLQLEFGEYGEMICQGYFPVWNVKSKLLKTSVYPKLLEDSLCFEHRILSEKLTENAKYLIRNNQTLRRIFYDDSSYQGKNEYKGVLTKEHRDPIQANSIHQRDLVIWCDQSRPGQWEALEILPVTEALNLRFALCNNKKTGRARRLQTKAEVFALVNELNCKDIKIRDVSVTCPSGFREFATYDMDFYITDKIGLSETSPKLYVSFEVADRSRMDLADDLSFIKTVLESVYPQYRILVEIV